MSEQHAVCAPKPVSRVVTLPGPRLKDFLIGGGKWYTTAAITTANEQVNKLHTSRLSQQKVNKLLLSFHAILHDCVYWSFEWMQGTLNEHIMYSLETNPSVEKRDALITAIDAFSNRMAIHISPAGQRSPSAKLAKICGALPELCAQFDKLSKQMIVAVMRSPIGRCIITSQNYQAMIPALEAVTRAGAGPHKAVPGFFNDLWKEQVSALLEVHMPSLMYPANDATLSLLGTLRKVARRHQGALADSICNVSFQPPTNQEQARACFLMHLISWELDALLWSEVTTNDPQAPVRPSISPSLLDLWNEVDTVQRGANAHFRRHLQDVELHYNGRLLPGCCSLACQTYAGPSEEALKTLLCSGCRRARYCCIKCQKDAWRTGNGGDGHSLVCAAWALL